MAVKRNLTGAQRCLLQDIKRAPNQIIEWPKKPYREMTLNALLDKDLVELVSAIAHPPRGGIKITIAGIVASA